MDVNLLEFSNNNKQFKLGGSNNGGKRQLFSGWNERVRGERERARRQNKKKKKKEKCVYKIK
jgi:hypothetical protein